MSNSPENTLLAEVESYYAEKLRNFGQTAQGVDWNGEQSQYVRFEQLMKIVAGDVSDFSLIDLGCGYGALLDFLDQRYRTATYIGVDVSKDMIHAAQTRYQSSANARFVVGSCPDTTADYAVASGVFNVRLERTDPEWFDYILHTLDTLDRSSRQGFAFNCLTSYSDADKKRDYLYYADPCRLFDVCKRRYSRHVALLHDYGLYEFTVLVRKMP